MDYIRQFSLKSPKKEVPKNHLIEDLYSPYKRAKDYITHLTKVFDIEIEKSAKFDSSCTESLSFKTKLPQIDGKFKLSAYPNAHLPKDMTDKIYLINAYSHLSHVKRSRPKFKPKSSMGFQKVLRKDCEKEALSSFFSKSTRLCARCNNHESNCHCKINRLRAQDRSLSPRMNDRVQNSSFFLTKINDFSKTISHHKKKPKLPGDLIEEGLFIGLKP